MVSKEVFMGELQKLTEQFGEKGFSRRKADLIFLAVNRLTQQELSRVVDDVIGNCRFAPTLDDFRERAKEYLANKAGAEMQPCTTCNASGIVNVRKKTGEVAEYAFSCNCQNGNYYMTLPKWQDRFQKEFTKQIIPNALINKYYENIQKPAENKAPKNMKTINGDHLIINNH